LATLLWFKREDEFKKQIDKMVHEAIEYELQNMRVILRRDL
jgi:hypothetical protein